jgi:ubiquinone/menaquinone biosynthesis C-methylase UbiE
MGWILGGIFVLVFIFLAAWLYGQRSRERVAGQEGIDDPEVAKAFNRVSTLPPWRLLRWYISRRTAQLADSGKAVDLGCGPGDLVLGLARKRPALHITGVELSEEMLAEAKARASHAGLDDRVAFKLGDAHGIPFQEDSMDLVISTLSLHHWHDPLTVFNEISRALRPGGGYLIFDLRRDMAAPFWLFLWMLTHVILPAPLKRANEPMKSRDAAYTRKEAIHLVSQSNLHGWRVSQGPLWLMIEGSQ